MRHIRLFENFDNSDMTREKAEEMFNFLNDKGEHALVREYKGKVSDSVISGVIGAWATSNKSIDEIVDEYWDRYQKIYKKNENMNEGATTKFTRTIDGDRATMEEVFKELVGSVERPGSYSGDWDQFKSVKVHTPSVKFDNERDVYKYIEDTHEKWDPAMAIEWQPNKWIIGGWVSE